MNMEADEFLDLMLTALAVWREARGESDEAMLGVAWVIRNRAEHPSWWGDSHASVVTKPYQFSSFNGDDPNASKFPCHGEVWTRCYNAARAALEGSPANDPTGGATHYHDFSLDLQSPLWTAEMTHTCNLSGLRFFKP